MLTAGASEAIGTATPVPVDTAAAVQTLSAALRCKGQRASVLVTTQNTQTGEVEPMIP